MSVVVFTAILTGAPNSMADLDLRCSSLSANLRESTSSYVSAVIDPVQLADVLLRPDGDLDIYKSVDGAAPVLMVSTNLQDSRLDHGGSSRSYRLTGTTAASFTPFSTHDLYPQDVITDRLLEDGRHSWQVRSDLNIMPGDTINYYETSTPVVYVIDLVSIVANAKGAQIIISEATA